MHDSRAGVNRNINEISERMVSKMAYEFLKKLYGTTKDGEQPKAMTYEELEAAIDGAKDIQVVDLKAGGYVAKDKLDGKITELDGVKKQLEDATKEIGSYKEMDIEGIKKSASEWETKYKEETKQLQQQIKDQQRQFAEEKFLSGYKFSDEFARAGVLAEFRSKEFKFDEKSGTFLGAEDYMKGIMESHKGAFIIEDNGGDAGAGGDGGDGGNGGNGGDAGSGGIQRTKPTVFLGKPGGQGAGDAAGNPFGFSFTGVRPNPNAVKQ